MGQPSRSATVDATMFVNFIKKRNKCCIIDSRDAVRYKNARMTGDGRFVHLGRGLSGYVLREVP